MNDSKQTEAAAVQQVLEQVWQRFADQDPEGMLELLHDSCTIWDIFQPDLVSKAEMSAYVEKDFGQSEARGQLSYEMHDYVIDVWDDTALARFYLDFDYQPPNPTTGHGRITVVLRRFSGEWRLVHVQEGHIPGGIPPIAAQEQS